MGELAAQIHRLPVQRPAIRFVDYAATYARDVIVHHRGASREQEILLALNRAFGTELLTSLDRERVQAWITARRLKVSGRTVNREVSLLKSMLRDAVPKYLEVSSLIGMKKLAVIPPKRRLMSPTEERKILAKLAPDMRAILLMGLDTLVRLGDILELRLDDDRGKTLFIRDPKDPTASASYSVPVSARLRHALDRLPKDGPYCFPGRRHAKDSHGRGASVRYALKAACEAAGVPYGRSTNGITFHWSTRRTGATRMLQRGAELKAVQEVGHWKRPDVMLEIYAESSSKAARAAVELVGPARRKAK